MSKIVPLFLALFAFTAISRAQNAVSVVNLASGKPEIAPGSVCEVRGVPIDDRATALMGRGGLPSQFRGVSVEVGGAAAGVWVISPGSVTFVMPRLKLRKSGLVDVVVTTPDGLYGGYVTVKSTAPGVFRAKPRDPESLWPLGMYRLGKSAPAILTDEPVPVSQGGKLTAVQFVTTGLQHAKEVQVRIGEYRLPLIEVGGFVFPWQETVTFELPEWLPARGLVEVEIVADGEPANPVWLRIQ